MMREQSIKISVVTISFNQAAYLQNCIDSVATQSGDWEHIIVDAGSTDGSREIIEKNRAHFSVVIFEEDKGPADGLNKGFRRASGTHGYFLNSDDLLLPNAFKIFMDNMSQNIFDDVLLFSGWIVDSLGCPVREVQAMKVSLSCLLEGSSIIFQQGLFFSLHAFEKVGGFNPDNRTSWDFEFLCDLLHQGYVSRVKSERIAAFRSYPGTISDNSRVGGGRDRHALDRLHIGSKFKYKHSFIINSHFFVILKKYLFNINLIMPKFDSLFRQNKIQEKWNNDISNR